MPLLWVKGVVKSGDELAYHLMIRDYYICVRAFDDADLLALFMNNRDLSGLAYNDIWFLEISLDYWNYRDRFVSQEVFSLLEKEFTVQQEKGDSNVSPQNEIETSDDSEDECHSQYSVCDDYELRLSPISEHMLRSFSEDSLSSYIKIDLSYDAKGDLVDPVELVVVSDDLEFDPQKLCSNNVKELVLSADNGKMSFKSFFIYWMNQTLPYCKSRKGCWILYSFCQSCAYHGGHHQILIDGVYVRGYSVQNFDFRKFFQDWISLWWLVQFQEQKDDFDDADWLFLNNCVENFSRYYSKDGYCFSYDDSLSKARCSSIEVCYDISDDLNRREVTGFRRLLLQKCRLVILKPSSRISHELMCRMSWIHNAYLTRQAERDIYFWSKKQKEVSFSKEKWKMLMYLKEVLENHEELLAKVKGKKGICVFDCGSNEVNEFEN